jgi:hypothetical protein
MGRSVTARVPSQFIDLVFLGADGSLATLFALEPLSAGLETLWSAKASGRIAATVTRILVFRELIDRLNSLRQSDDYGDNAPEVFYFFPILPSSAGGR